MNGCFPSQRTKKFKWLLKNSKEAGRLFQVKNMVDLVADRNYQAPSHSEHQKEEKKKEKEKNTGKSSNLFAGR